METLKGLYVLNDDAFEDIYGPPERAALASLLEIYAPHQTAAALRDDSTVLREADVVLSGWGAPLMDASFLAAAPRLKAVFYGAGSVRGVVTDALWKRGIRVTSAASTNAVPVAEYTLAVILFSLKHGWRLARETRAERTFPSRAGISGGYGSVVGLISLGYVGRLVRERLRPFDLRVLAYDPYTTADEAALLGVELVSLQQVFRLSDVVSVHAPLLEQTVGLITGAHIAAMKPGATFINTARGALIKEKEFITVLARRPDLQAVLDVTDPEPPISRSPLYTLPNVVLTPHIAGACGRECRRLGQMIVDEVRRYLRGEVLKGEVTHEQVAVRA